MKIEINGVISEEGTSKVYTQATIYGSSTESKPTGYADGSVFIETDTHKIYMYDETANQWRELS